jgi:iron complex transport system substrate-binding protein
VSAVAIQAQGLPTVAPSAEALILSGAETVVLNTYGETKTQILLEHLGVEVFRVPYDPDLSSIPTSLRRLALQLKAPLQGQALAADFEQRVAHLSEQRPKTSVLAAYYRPDGGSAGQETYVSQTMDLAGYHSLASERGNRGWGRLDLEQLILHSPEVLITSFFDRNGYSARQAFSRHPVFKRLFGSLPIVAIPGRLWGCGGYTVILAAEEMARQRNALRWNGEHPP